MREPNEIVEAFDILTERLAIGGEKLLIVSAAVAVLYVILAMAVPRAMQLWREWRAKRHWKRDSRQRERVNDA